MPNYQAEDTVIEDFESTPNEEHEKELTQPQPQVFESLEITNARVNSLTNNK